MVEDQGLTRRVRRKVERDFPGRVEEVLDLLRGTESGNQDRERVVAAVLLMAAGNEERLREGVRLSQLDWRDVLVAGGMADGGWPRRLRQELGW